VELAFREAAKHIILKKISETINRKHVIPSNGPAKKCEC
jgi:hypothetical protein